MSQAAPASITEEAAISNEDLITGEAACEPTAHPGYKWDQLGWVIMVSGMFNHIWKNLSVNLHGDAVNTTVATLNQMLWADIASIAVKPCGCNIKGAQEPVQENHQHKGSKHILLSKNAVIYNRLIETLK